MSLALFASTATALTPLPGRLPELPATGPVSGRIFNGAPTSDFPAVAEILILNGDSSVALCSGTLIEPTIVLTAGHCLSFDPRAAFIRVFPNGGAGVRYDAVAYSVHPDFNLNVIAFSDASILVLGGPVAGVAPLSLATRTPRAHAKGTIVGFGQDGDVPGSEEVKRVGTVRLRHCPRAIRRVGIFAGQLSTSVCWKPKRRGNDTCPGDSGGPLLVDGAVAGVTSGGYGVATCPGFLSWDTSVVKVRDWLDAAIAQATTP